jgi:WD40 repeat protein
MTPALAGRLSRFLVACHPRRWRQRYGDELLDVLGQHRAGARTVLDLTFSAADAHLDPAWRMQPSMAGLRRGARAAAPWSAALAALVLVVGALVTYQAWQEGHWHPGYNAGVTALAFSPDHRILVSAAGFDEDGTDTIWDVADPAQPRQLATFEGGAPTAISPDGRTVATVSFHDQPVLWNVADPARPARMVTLPGVRDTVLWGQAFSPDGRVLAAAYTSRIDLWDVTGPGRPRRLTTLPFTAAAPPHWYGFPGAIAFSPDGHTLAATTSHNRVGVWDVTSPAQAARIATAAGHTAPVAALAFSPRGHLLADIGYDGAVIVYSLADPAHPTRAATLETLADPRPDPAGGFYDTQYALAFSPDGRTLTAIADSTAPGPGPATPPGETVSRWHVTSAGAATPVTTVSRDPASSAGQLALAPSGRTLARGAPPGGSTIGLTALP